MDDLLDISTRLEAAVARLGWPNDVVQRELGGTPGRKLAGVLIEKEVALALVGMGINVMQQRADWPEELSRRVTSLHELGARCDRAAVAQRLLEELEAA